MMMQRRRGRFKQRLERTNLQSEQTTIVKVYEGEIAADAIDRILSVNIASDSIMVSLVRKSPEERLTICRKYYTGKKLQNTWSSIQGIRLFVAGFAFLPLLWLINAIRLAIIVG